MIKLNSGEIPLLIIRNKTIKDRIIEKIIDIQGPGSPNDYTFAIVRDGSVQISNSEYKTFD